MDRLSQLLSFHEEDPTDSFIRYAIASEYVKLGRLKDAKNMFESLLRDDPAYIGTYYHLGKLYDRLGDDASARRTYKSGIAVATEISDLHARSELQAALLEAEGFGFD